jgi:hypothetical protein
MLLVVTTDEELKGIWASNILILDHCFSNQGKLQIPDFGEGPEIWGQNFSPYAEIFLLK